MGQEKAKDTRVEAFKVLCSEKDHLHHVQEFMRDGEKALDEIELLRAEPMSPIVRNMRYPVAVGYLSACKAMEMSLLRPLQLGERHKNKFLGNAQKKFRRFAKSPNHPFAVNVPELGRSVWKSGYDLGVKKAFLPHTVMSCNIRVAGADIEDFVHGWRLAEALKLSRHQSKVFIKVKSIHLMKTDLTALDVPKGGDPKPMYSVKHATDFEGFTLPLETIKQTLKGREDTVVAGTFIAFPPEWEEESENMRERRHPARTARKRHSGSCENV